IKLSVEDSRSTGPAGNQPYDIESNHQHEKLKLAFRQPPRTEDTRRPATPTPKQKECRPPNKKIWH
ncbi:hypothetical protein, partial [Rhodococcus spongiicola]|uniref:hypothetical protein n=1 Tax=Rhodococcus spongiicola TaxID=2487352 RepID=UPI0019D44F5B